MLRVLSEPGNLEQSARPTTFHNDFCGSGHNPYHDDRVYEQPLLEAWFGRTYVQRWPSSPSADRRLVHVARPHPDPAGAGLLRREAPLAELPARHDLGALSAREGGVPRARLPRHGSLRALLRRSPGYPGFGRPVGASDEDYLRGGLRQMAVDLRNSWLQPRRPRAPGPIRGARRGPGATVTAILAYLGLDSSAETVQHVLAKGSQEVLDLPGASNDPKELQDHRTTADARSSVGRWRRGRDGSLRALADDVSPTSSRTSATECATGLAAPIGPGPSPAHQLLDRRSPRMRVEPRVEGVRGEPEVGAVRLSLQVG